MTETPPPPQGDEPPPVANPYGATPYPASPEPAAPVGTQPGGLGERFLARLIDGVMLGVVELLISVATGRVVAGIIGGILYLGYYAYMESSQGGTYGKRWLKLRVHGASGGNPSMDEALRRNGWAALSIITSIPILGIVAGLAELVAVIAIAVTISQDALNRGWHDKFANTSVTKG